ncbi:ankyrin repeat domain-containing protein [Streptosporangium longisporum]|uniref:Ankyrin repeat domain-containing protein n=1 Tax=Streptosporangium longisporum TaxID=46187 RepID=A0ABP6KNF5_9ACTN
MAVTEGAGWSGLGWNPWTDLAAIRARLDAGADPNSGTDLHRPPLHHAAEEGSPEVVAELARRVDDVDAEHEGRTALWLAVFNDRPDNARALAAAGADPWRPMMNGWSPGRLSLAGPTLGLFSLPADEIGLSADETAAVTEARRLITALGDVDTDGLGLACVAGVGAAEAVRRLEATSADDDDMEAITRAPWPGTDTGLAVVGVTDVPGGCIVSQPWGYIPSVISVNERLSMGTVCYGLYVNPKSGNQGSIARDGVIEEWDTYPGSGDVSDDEPSEEILAAYLYQDEAVAYCCARVGLRPADARSITGPPDMWLRLPGHHWRH